MAQQTYQYDAHHSHSPNRASKIWLIALGVGTTFLGGLCFYMTFATTLLSVITIGAVLVFASLFQGAFAISAGRLSGFALHILLTILYSVGGLSLLINPIVGALSLTLFLGFLFFAIGVFRVVASIAIRFRGWAWTLVSGVVTATLGVFALLNLPTATGYLIGSMVAVDLVFFGIYLLAFGAGLPVLKASRPQLRTLHTVENPV